MLELGYNYRLTDIQAALGSSQLMRADEGLARRKEIAARYEAAFSNTIIRTFPVPTDQSHAYHLYVVSCEKRKELFDWLRQKNIFAQVHYIPVHMLPYYQDQGFRKGQYPVAEAYYESCISLPMFPTLTDEEQEYVISTVLSFYK